MTDLKFAIQFRGREILMVGRVTELTHTRAKLELIDIEGPNWKPSGKTREVARESVKLFASMSDVEQMVRASRRDAGPMNARVTGSINTR